ncbi:MAG: UPF0149 family protein [Oxalobacteraceae bacterium]
MSEEQLMTDKEFDELDRFLMSEQCSDDAMTMDALHGYLTAIAIGPESVATEEWLPRVWGTEPEDEPEYRNAAQAERIHRLCERMLEDIVVTFAVAPKDFEPLFCEHQWKGKPVLDAEAWAWGFTEGMQLRIAAWQLLQASPQAGLLRAIILLGAEEIEEAALKLVDDPLKCHKLAVEIEASIPQIYRFWAAHKKSKAH